MKLLALIIFLLPDLLDAGNPFLAAGSQATALSGMQMFSGKQFSGINNLSMYKHDKTSYGICLNKPYFLNEIVQLDAFYIKSYKHHDGVVYFRSLNATDYSYNSVGLGFGIQIHPKIRTSIQTEFQFEHISGYGNTIGNTWKVSFTTLPFEKSHLAWLVDISLPNSNKQTFQLYQIFAWQYSMSKQSKLLAEIQWQQDQIPLLKLGFNFEINTKWQFYSGCTFSTGNFATGLTYKKKNISYGFAIRYHQVLGSGNALQINYGL